MSDFAHFHINMKIIFCQGPFWLVMKQCFILNTAMDDQRELFVVVDREDKIVGFRSRYDCHHDKTLIHRAVNVVVYDDSGRILLQKRSMTKDTSPGYWTISATGHVSKGETYKKTAGRELEEEIGVKLTVAFAYKFLIRYTRESEMEAVFHAKSNGPFYPNPQEVDKVKFFSKDELATQVQAKTIPLTTLAREILKREKFLS